MKKCKLFKHEVDYLGRIVSPEGYRIGPSNVKAVQEVKNSVPKEAGGHTKTVRPGGLLQKVHSQLCMMSQGIV